MWSWLERRKWIANIRKCSEVVKIKVHGLEWHEGLGKECCLVCSRVECLCQEWTAGVSRECSLRHAKTEGAKDCKKARDA